MSAQRIIHDLAQGSEAWHAHRGQCDNASDAPAMLGVSPYVTRTDLIRSQALGIEREVSPQEQQRFDDGHAYEAMARPWAEEIIGEELYPITASLRAEGLPKPLSASYDGVTLAEDVIFEHKTLNQALAAALAAGEIPAHYKPQIEQQLLILGAERCLFMASNGSRETMKFAWYTSDPRVRAALIPGWKQFQHDVANYQHVEVIQKAMPDPVRDLPAILIDVRIERDEESAAGGKIAIVSTLQKFGEQLTAYLKGLPEKPENDQDFANLEQAVKSLKLAEERLEASEATALARFATVEEMRATVAMLQEVARVNRLRIDKLVTARKAEIREEIRIDGLTKFGEHIAKLNTRLGGAYMPPIEHKFAEVMKGKKTVESLRDAVATEVARLKILANEVADRIDANVKLVRSEENKTYLALFPDLVAICMKPCEDFANLVARRINEHKEAETNRLEGERERIRLEEEAKARAKVEAEAKVKADEEARKRVADIVVPADNRGPFTPPSVAPTPLPLSATTHATAAPAKATRPTDGQIIAALAQHFRVHESQVIAWLLDMDLREHAVGKKEVAA